MSTFINQQKSWRKVLGWLSSTSIIGIFSSRVTRSFSSSVNSKEARYTPLRIEKKRNQTTWSIHHVFFPESITKGSEPFSTECRKSSGITLVLLYFALWLVRPPNKSDAKLKPITTWWLAFSRTLNSLVVFISSSRLPLKVFCDLTLVLVLRQSIGKSVLLLSNKVYPEKVRMSETINVLKPLWQSVMIRVTWCIFRQKAYIMKVSQNKSVNFSEMPWQRFK